MTGIDELFKAAEQLDTPKPGANDIGSMIQQACEFLDKVNMLSEKAKPTIDYFDQKGLLRVLVLGVAKYLNVNPNDDVSKLIGPINPTAASVQPAYKSETHRQLFEHFNKMSEEQLKSTLTRGQQAAAQITAQAGHDEPNQP